MTHRALLAVGRRLVALVLFGALVTCTEDRTPTSLPTSAPGPTAAAITGITQALLTVGNNTVNQKIYTTAGISPAPNALITVAVLGHNSTAAPPSPTVTGGGMATWTVIASVTFDAGATPHKRLTVYQALAAAPGSGPLTITFTNSVSNCQWIVTQWSGATGIAQSAITQADAATGLTVNLATFGNSNDVAYGIFGLAKGAPAVTAGTGFTLQAEQGSGESPATDLAAESATNLTGVTATWGSANAGAIALEIAAGSSGPPPTTSTLSLSISGTGSVSFSPAFQSGGSCANPATASCSAVYLTTDNVTLTAAAPSGWTFSGWSGACTGTGTCSLAMSVNRAVTATFSQSAPTTHVLTLSVAGNGQTAFSVTPQPGGTCSTPATTSCTAVFLSTDNVTLTPSAGFTGWGGDCTGTGTCALAMSADHAVTVTFGSSGGGAITQTVLASGNNAVNQKIYTTAGFAAAPNALITVAVLGHNSTAAPASPTLSGGGMTAWTVVSSVTFDGVATPHKRLTVYRALSAAPGSGPLTITFSSSVSNCQWMVTQWSGVDPSGTNGAGAIGQVGTNRGDASTGLTVGLGAFGSPSNAAYGVFGVAKSTPSVSPGAGFTELVEQASGESPAADLEGESATNLSSIRATWASGNAGAIGMEIRAGNGAPPVFDLAVDHIYVTQAAQTLNDSVVSIAGRPALVRVFVRATLASASVPSVRLTFTSGATLLSSTTIAGTGPAPTVLDEGNLSSTWNYSVPGSLVQPGVSITAEVDPDHLITEGNEGNNTLTFAEVVRSTAPQSYRFVPIKQTGNQLTGNVTSANLSTYGDTAYRLFPITQPTLSLHATYTTSTNVDANTDAVWTQILSEIDALRVAENSPATYVGVVRVTYTSGIVGIGYIGRPTAVVYDDQVWRGVTVAHELGHTYNRQHAPGCGAGSPDKNYPYAGGIDGVYGSDVFSSPALLYAPTIHDIMGYCDDNWISDYTYTGILNYIATSNLVAATLPAQRSILVWGSIIDGVPSLEPAFVLTAQPVAPGGAGSYQVQGLDQDGAVLFTQAFEPTAVADVRTGEAGTFAFALPLSDLVQSRLVSLRLAGRGREFIRAMTAAPAGVAPAAAQGVVQSWQGNRATITWDTAAAPTVMVRDPASGQILSIARGGTVEVETRGPDLDLLLSNGVASTVQRLRLMR